MLLKSKLPQSTSCHMARNGDCGMDSHSGVLWPTESKQTLAWDVTCYFFLQNLGKPGSVSTCMNQASRLWTRSTGCRLRPKQSSARIPNSKRVCHCVQERTRQYMVVALHRGPQYRPSSTIILIIGTPLKSIPDFGKPPYLHTTLAYSLYLHNFPLHPHVNYASGKELLKAHSLSQRVHVGT